MKRDVLTEGVGSISHQPADSMEAEDDDRASTMTAEPHLLRHGAASKGFASLARIVAVISTVPPDPDACRRGGGRGLAVDLNLRLGLPPLEIAMESPEEEVKEASASASSGAMEIVSPSPSGDVEKISEIVEEEEEEGEGIVSPAQSAAVTAEKSSIDECDEEKAASEDGNGVSGGGEGYLWLLLEAVRHVSGKSEEAAAGSKRRRREYSPPPLPPPPPAAAAAAAVPLVRSRRRRNQELPLRYRDSVLEPWVKLPTAPRNGRSARSGNRR